MHSRTNAEHFLALFTDRERAATIVGDLLEQSRAHRRGWFVREVVVLAFALCLRGPIAAPLRALRLALFGSLVYAVAYVVLFVAFGLPWHPWHRVDDPSFWLRMMLAIVAASALTGAVLVRWTWRQRQGSGAVAPLALLWFATWLISPFFNLLLFSPAWMDMVWRSVLFPFLYLLPLVLGGLLAERRLTTQGDSVPHHEPELSKE